MKIFKGKSIVFLILVIFLSCQIPISQMGIMQANASVPPHLNPYPSRGEGLGEGLLFYHFDHLSSSSVMTDSGGAVRESVKYYPFGKTRISVMSNEQRAMSSGTPYLFTGQENDPESELYYYIARYYDPKIGKFISTDPIMQTVPNKLNKYSYAINNPLRYTDPTGQDAWEDVRDFTNAFVDQMRVNNIGGEPLKDPQGSEAAYWGRQAGNFASGIQASAEISGGSTLVSGGTLALAPTGGISTPAIVAGAGLTAHGIQVMSNTLSNTYKMENKKGDGNKGSTTSQNENKVEPKKAEPKIVKKNITVDGVEYKEVEVEVYSPDSAPIIPDIEREADIEIGGVGHNFNKDGRLVRDPFYSSENNTKTNKNGPDAIFYGRYWHYNYWPHNYNKK